MEEDRVGRQFVVVYFNTLLKNPSVLLDLYKESSTLTRREDGEIVTYKGLKEIGQAIRNTKPNCLLDVRNVVCQKSFENSLIVTVSGLVEKPGEEVKRPFTQVFVLHPQQPEGLFVLNEIYLNTDIAASGEQSFLSPEETDLPAEEPQKPTEEVSETSEASEEKEQGEKEGSEVENEATPEKQPEVKEEVQVVDPKPDTTPVEEVIETPPAEKSKQPTENAKPTKKSGKPQKKKEAKKNSEAESTNTAKVESEEVKEKKQQSWAEIAKRNAALASPTVTPPVSANPTVTAVAAPKKVASPKETPKDTPKRVQSDSRYLEVCDFHASAKLDTLKTAFRGYGNVTYVHFLGHTRALVEFQNAETVNKILAQTTVRIFFSCSLFFPNFISNV